jgi:hypothetical protein
MITRESTPSGRVLIPYFTNDDGERPLPSTAVAWLCTFILVNGVPFKGERLVRGDTLTLAVRIANRGRKPLHNVLTRVWWANPSVGMSRSQLVLIAEKPLGRALVGPAVTTGLTTPWLIGSEVPEHVCLIAQVSHDQDPAPDAVTPGAERHFAQQNLQLRTAAPGGQLQVAFQALILAGNLGQTLLQAQPTQPATLQVLNPIIQAQALPLRTDVRLTNLGPVPSGTMSAWQAAFTVPTSAQPGQILALDLTESLVASTGTTLIGGITVLVRVVPRG